MPERSAGALVVGAGMAGLSCASALAERGVSVVVVESRRVVGGRASSWVDPGANTEIDDGPHLLAGAYTEVRAMLARVGAPDPVADGTRLRVPMRDRDGRCATLSWTALPGRLGLLEGALRFGALPLGERILLAHVPLAASRGEPSEDRSLDGWLDELRQGERARRWLWHPLARAVFNEDPEIVSARLFAEVLRRLLLGKPGASSLAHAGAGLSRAWAEPAAAYVESRGGTVLRGRRVVAVERVSEGMRAELAAGGAITAPALCLAVPAARALPLTGVLRAADRSAIARAAACPTTPVVSVNLWLEGAEPVLDEPFLGFAGEPFAWCFDRSHLVPASDAATTRHVVLVAPGDREMAARGAGEAIRLARDTLESFAPLARSRRLVFARAVCERHAAPSLTPAAATARPAVETGEPDVMLAGDWTDTGLPATLEGAAWSGHRAAARIAAFLAGGGRATVGPRCSSSPSSSSS